jgi:hypothetical protein
MSSKVVPPELGAKSFSCPHCGAIAHQHWQSLFIKAFDKDVPPWMPDQDVLEQVAASREIDAATKPGLKEFFRKKLTRKPFAEKIENSSYLQWQLENVCASECFSCKAWSVWVADELVYPHQKYLVEPNADMPDHIKPDFLEAAAVIDISARSAAALLRLCIQKIVINLGENGGNLNQDIRNLVEKGAITRAIQQALDVVRVVGNNAVHPGVIDFNDNKTIAVQLFGLVNVIVESTIGTPKHIQSMYEKIVPETARAAIEKRDTKRLEGPKDRTNED